MSFKQLIRNQFQSSEYKVEIPNHSEKLRKWQWWGDTNNDHLLTFEDLEPFTNENWSVYDSKGDGHCFYNTLHRFMLENRLYKTTRQKIYNRGQKDGIEDCAQIRFVNLKNGKTGQKKYDPPILYLRKLVLSSILKKDKISDYINKKSKLEEKDVKKMYIDILKNNGFFEESEQTDIIKGFNDAINFKGTSGWVEFGQIAVVALVLKINIIVWSEAANIWKPFYARKFDYDEDEDENRDTLREEPVCFMNFTGNHYQNLVPKSRRDLKKQASKNHKAYEHHYNRRFGQRQQMTREVLSELEKMEKDNDFKRIPPEVQGEAKEEWVWDRLRKRKWNKEQFLKNFGVIQENEWVCEKCKNVNDKGYKKCGRCKKERKKEDK